MESLSLLAKLQSTYIARNIVTYFADKIHILRLIKYNKKLMGLFNLGVEDYKAKSFEFLNYSKFENFLSSKRGSIKYLKKALKDDLKKYDKKVKNTISDEFSEIFFTNKYNYYKNNQPIKKNILDNQYIIDIYSPLFERLSKMTFFQDLFIIRIPIPFIIKNDLMKDYVQVFEKLNESNINFSSLCFEFDPNTDNYLSDIQNFNVDYQKIKKLIFEGKKRKTNVICKELLLSKTIFTNNNIINNLIYLEIKNKNKSLEYDLEKINDFKCLEELRLENVFLSKYFTLKLKPLKYLALCNCNQIIISENCALNLKSLSLFRSCIKNLNGVRLKFPELEQLKISFCLYNSIYNIDDNQLHFYADFKQKTDLKSFKKLKYLFRGDISLLLALENNPLEKAYISSYTLDYYNKSDNSEEDEKKMIKKLIDIKTLKEIKLNLSFINSKDIESIEGENASVKKLIIDLHKENDDNILFNLQKKFPNLTDLEIYDNVS